MLVSSRRIGHFVGIHVPPYFSTNFLLFLMFSSFVMNIQIRLFVYLIILIKMQCLNFNLVPISVVTIVSCRYIGNFEGKPT